VRIIDGIATTTHELPDGFSHSREALEGFAAVFNTSHPPVHHQHRADLPPIGIITKAWVELMDDSVHYALRVEIQSSSDVTDAEVESILDACKGMSMSFFGDGLGNSVAPDAKPEFTVGLTRALWDGVPDVFDEISAAFPSTSIEVRRLYEHAAVNPESVIIWFVATLGSVVVDALFRERVVAVLRAVKRRVRVTGVAPDWVRVAVSSDHGRVEVRVPWRDDEDEVQKEVTCALESALAANRRERDAYAPIEESKGPA